MEEKEYLLTIVGRQTDEEESDEVELFTTGNFYRTDHSWCIAYDESEATGFEGNRTVLELEDDLRQSEEARKENEQLGQLLDLQQKRQDFSFQSARVAQRSTDNWTNTLTLSLGSDAGLAVGDCVITEYGALVGQVCELGDTWATVRTVIDVNMDVGAFVGSNSYAGVISGEFSLMKQGLTRVTYLASGAQIFTEDEVLTSGKGGAFPSGLLIGTVTTVMTQAGGQNTYGVIEPACDVDALSQVFIVTDYEIVE